MKRDNFMYDVFIIGQGLAGMSAAVFAAKKQLAVAQAGATGGIDFSTGLFDLMAVHPVQEGRVWDNPFHAITALTKDIPRHPYALVSAENIKKAFSVVLDFLRTQGLEYTGYREKNASMLMPTGTIKHTWKVPLSSWQGVMAFEEKAPTLIVNFRGHKGFSGRQIVSVQGKRWPALQSVSINFPGMSGELYAEHMALALGEEKNCKTLAYFLAKHLQGIEYIGLPSILGSEYPMRLVNRLQHLTGCKVFEIPTLPPSLEGTRLRRAFSRGLAEHGVKTFSQKLVLQAEKHKDGYFILHVGDKTAATEVKASCVVLATGRFFAKGLQGQRGRVIEPLFNLPVTEPEGEWYNPDFFTPCSHPISLSGIEVDKTMRPLTAEGVAFCEGLYAAGAVLGHQDWTRMKCGAGVAIGTAWQAVESLGIRGG